MLACLLRAGRNLNVACVLPLRAGRYATCWLKLGSMYVGCKYVQGRREYLP